MDDARYGHLIALWDIQDTLLQSYRSLFLGSQSILFGIAVFVAQGTVPLLSAILFLVAMPIIRVWRDITEERGYDVWFFQLRLMRLEAGMEAEARPMEAFKAWQKLDL